MHAEPQQKGGDFCAKHSLRQPQIRKCGKHHNMPIHELALAQFDYEFSLKLLTIYNSVYLLRI